ncbi:MAG: hypothetical protein HGA87_00995 [Desulfobulbaceae bacterium]|nr:hypothetical protein [Desulfobulbaceae bacterium]
MNRIIFTPGYYPDPTSGRPVANGYIYVGEPDTDPEIVANQKSISVQQENGVIVPVAQPLSTGAGGVPMYGGSPVTILVNGNYSLKVLDSNSSQVYYIPSNADMLSVVEQADLYTDLRAIAASADGQQASVSGRIAIGDGGGGLFYWDSSDLSAEVTIDTLSGIYVAPTTDLTGASGAWIRVHNSISTSYYGPVANGIADDTLPLQAAIDCVLESDLYSDVHIPAGNYKFSKLTLYKAASTVDRAKRGKIKLIGAGALASPDLFGTTSNTYGTILTSTSAVDNAIIISNADDKVRATQLESLTIIYGGSGYAVQADYCPGLTLENVSIGVTSADGSGLSIADTWISAVNNCRIINESSVIATSTGYGAYIDNTLFAGLLTFSDCQIDGFHTGVHCAAGSNWSNIVFRDTAIQKYNTYGWRVLNAPWLFSIENCYTESLTDLPDNVLLIDTSSKLRTLKIDGLFILGGSTTATAFNGPLLKIANVVNYSMKNIHVFRPWTALLDATTAAVDGTVGTVDNVGFYHDNVAALPAGPLYAFTGTHVPAVNNYAQTNPTTKLACFDPAYGYPKSFDSNGLVTSRFSLSTIVSVNVSDASVYAWNTAVPRPAVVVATSTSAADAIIRLPDFAGSTVPDGTILYVASKSTSAGNILLKNASDATTLVTVTAGQTIMCICDKTLGAWRFVLAGTLL